MGWFSVKCRRKPSHEKTFDVIGIHVLMIALFSVFATFDDCAFPKTENAAPFLELRFLFFCLAINTCHQQA